MKKKLLLVTSLDVEEEGLFSGHYPRKNPQVTNVAQLYRLAPLTQELGILLTLFCTYSVFTSPQAARHLDWLRTQCSIEIGAHLHHWCTPPQTELHDGPPERTATLDKSLLAKRLDNLLEAGKVFTGTELKSFRMGRWDFSSRLLPMLASRGIITDSSICPLRSFKNGPDHFLAPADPYWIKLENGFQILEAPITQVTLFKFLPGLWKNFAGLTGLNVDLFHYFGALSVNPFWHNEEIMRLATRIHVARGGQLINIFWHSSELLPGASPQIPDEKARDKALAKIWNYFVWLQKNYQVQPLTASQLATVPWASGFSRRTPEAERDW